MAAPVIVYSARVRRETPARVLDEVGNALDALGTGAAVRHEDAVDALVEVGVAEAAVVDALSASRDADTAAVRRWREWTMAAGRLVLSTWRGRCDEAVRWRDTLRSELRALRQSELPAVVEPRVPEGYAFYGLYPESFIEATRAFASALHPERAVVIGIRSIGTSLSAVVAAALEESGTSVETCTVRPRGHPFDRHLDLGPELTARLAARKRDWFAVVDEGPGLSGSSFASVAEALAAAGVPDERIVFFPSWDPDPDTLRSERARRRWRSHRRYVAAAESVWPGADGGVPLRDLSAGQWRAAVIGPGRSCPAVHPQHERRKYRRADSGGAVMLKFEGLGSHGRRAWARAQRLADAGFAPRPLRLERGFIAYEWIDGEPLEVGEVDGALLGRIADYAAFLRRECPSGGPAPFADALEMIAVNAREGLGIDCSRAVDRLRDMEGAVASAPAVAVDGRMLAHEWMRTREGRIVKTDGVDHHDDHFWPGPRDVAWDVAGAGVEMDLDSSARDHLASAYAAASGDRSIRDRLPFHRVAYLAYRMGYAALAAETLGPSADGLGFSRLRGTYAARLRADLQGFCP
jgi:hypothetical protein